MHITSVFIHIYSNKNNHNLDYCWWYELIGRFLLSIIHVAWATCFSLSYYKFEQILNGNVQELSLFDLYSAKLVMNEHKNHGRMYKQVLVSWLEPYVLIHVFIKNDFYLWPIKQHWIPLLNLSLQFPLLL